MPAPDSIVKEYLTAMEARNLDLAQSFLAKDFTMTFPGGQRFQSLQELVSWAKTRYTHVTKAFEHFDVAGSDDGSVVYCSGTLSGTWLDGTAFSSIRFIDRFIVSEGKIVLQQVWNDIGEITRRGKR